MGFNSIKKIKHTFFTSKTSRFTKLCTLNCLDDGITSEKIILASASIKCRKAPALDGYPACVIHIFLKFLDPNFLTCIKKDWLNPQIWSLHYSLQK